MKYALIGCGRISPNHISAAINNNLDIVALCDIDIEKAKELISKHKLSNSVKIYSNYKLMLQNEEIDLIGIATESGRHAKIAKECIEANKHLIIEKPIALSLKDVDDIIYLSKKHKVIVSACHQNRFNKSIQKIREAMEDNRFGRLFYGTAHVRWNRDRTYYDQALWRGTWEQDGGALMNQCIHNIDLLRWMMGNEIEEVCAYTDNLNHNYIEAEDFGVVIIKFKNGSYGIIDGSTNIYPKNLEETLYIFGEKGTVKVGGKSVNIIEEWLFEDKSDDSHSVKSEYSESPPNVYGFGHTPLYSDVIASIKEHREPYVTAEDGKRALELVLAVYQSSKERRPIKFPLKYGSTIEFSTTFDKRQ